MNESRIADIVTRKYVAGEDWEVTDAVKHLVPQVVQEIKRRGGSVGSVRDNKIQVSNLVLDEDHGIPLEIALYEGSHYPGKVLINETFSGIHPVPVKDRIPFNAKGVVDAVVDGFMSLVNYRKASKTGGMSYPTRQQVEHATLYQLVRWGRYLPSPGENFIDQDNFEEMMEKEVPIMNRIIQRRDEIGITPEVSKAVGWERRSDDLCLRPDSADAAIDIGLNEAMDELEYQGHKMWTASKDFMAGKMEDEVADQIRSVLIHSKKVVTEKQMLGLITFNGPKSVFEKTWDSMIRDEYLIKDSPGHYKWNDEGSFTEK